ncbi:MAG: hypothetical protein M4579_007213 [Chaenotheca gracillima]|nr:MAG: hypothetical protein M4579_007213 [Chaenotheca gracillima]
MGAYPYPLFKSMEQLLYVVKAVYEAGHPVFVVGDAFNGIHGSATLVTAVHIAVPDEQMEPVVELLLSIGLKRASVEAWDRMPSVPWPQTRLRISPDHGMDLFVDPASAWHLNVADDMRSNSSTASDLSEELRSQAIPGCEWACILPDILKYTDAVIDTLITLCSADKPTTSLVMYYRSHFEELMLALKRGDYYDQLPPENKFVADLRRLGFPHQSYERISKLRQRIRSKEITSEKAKELYLGQEGMKAVNCGIRSHRLHAIWAAEKRGKPIPARWWE